MGGAFRICFRHSFRDRNTPFSGRRRALLSGYRRTGRERQRCPQRLTCAASARCVANHTMYPLIRPGSIVQIDGNQRKVLPVHWENEHERPIFFIELREEYICSWCQIREGHLLAVPYPNSRCEIRRFPYPREAEIVGRVTGVTMRLAESQS
jgi:hypothetical protein